MDITPYIDDVCLFIFACSSIILILPVHCDISSNGWDVYGKNTKKIVFILVLLTFFSGAIGAYYQESEKKQFIATYDWVVMDNLGNQYVSDTEPSYSGLDVQTVVNFIDRATGLKKRVSMPFTVSKVRARELPPAHP